MHVHLNTAEHLHCEAPPTHPSRRRESFVGQLNNGGAQFFFFKILFSFSRFLDKDSSHKKKEENTGEKKRAEGKENKHFQPFHSFEASKRAASG